MTSEVPEGEAVVLDVPQLETLLRKTFNIGLDVGRGAGPPRALVRLRLATALLGVAEVNATAAKGIAIEREIGTEAIAQSEAFALHAAALNGMPGESRGASAALRSSASALVSRAGRRVALRGRGGGGEVAAEVKELPEASRGL